MDKYTELIIELSEVYEQKERELEETQDEGRELTAEVLNVEHAKIETQEKIDEIKKKTEILRSYENNKWPIKRSLTLIGSLLFIATEIIMNKIFPVDAIWPETWIVGFPAIMIITTFTAAYLSNTKEARNLKKKYTLEMLEEEYKEELENLRVIDERKIELDKKSSSLREKLKKISEELRSIKTRIQSVEERKQIARETIMKSDVFEAKLNETYEQEKLILQRGKDEE